MRKTLEPTTLRTFREEFGGEVVLPEDPGYDAARIVWNGLVDRRPAMVARCSDVEDVIAALRLAREHDLVVAVRSGGHSVGGFSTCDGGIVIDLSRMRGVSVDAEARIARVQGGTLLGELDREAQALGLACPVGVVSHTGVAGLTLGGGMGRLQRRHGFTIDNLLSVDLVTADGRLVRASENEEPELFWGIRGAGPNFGIVTSFEFRLHPVGPMVTHGWVVHPLERARELASMFREFALGAPDDVFASFALGVVGPEDPWPELVGKPVVIIGAAHAGAVEAADRDLRPLRDGDPLQDTVAQKTYLEMQGAGAETFAWGKRFYMKGGYMDGLPDEVIDAAVDLISGAPGECSIGLWTLGGAIARVPDDAMAFTGRATDFWVGVEVFWEDPSQDEAYMGWGRTGWDALKPFTAAGHYVNDQVESSEEIARATYGDGKYERLVGLKRAWDPENVFRLNQNIRP